MYAYNLSHLYIRYSVDSLRAVFLTNRIARTAECYILAPTHAVVVLLTNQGACHL